MAEKPEDLSLPVASVNRVINDALPDNVNVSQETRKVISKAASVFVLYSTATAAGLAKKAGRKTLNTNDVMEAMSEMEFPGFRDQLEKLLAEYRKTQKRKRESSAAAAASTSTSNKKKSEGGGGDKKKVQVKDKDKDGEENKEKNVEVVDLSDDEEKEGESSE